jgi:hypothetical protein
MKRSSRPRATVELPDSFQQQLNAYALAAGAAGVGLLALAQSAEARIIYTPAHAKVGQPLPVDLNHDGIVDFYLLRYSSLTFGVYYRALSACQTLGSYRGPFCLSMHTNAIRDVVSNGRSFGAPLRAGDKIQHGDRFLKFNAQLGDVAFNSNGTSWRGPWFNGGKGVKNRYLGLKFKIKGKFHFGWARIAVTTTSNNFTATLTGYAYETIPGKAIIAGKTNGSDVTIYPASLGHLAAGASAVSSWRVQQTAATSH